MMYVVCFYWKGDRWKEEDGASPSEYVNKLYRGVARNTNDDFHFICFTNENLEVQEGIELRSLYFISKQGVLPRAYVFSRDAGLFGHQVLVLDLDVVITGSLEDIMGYEGFFCTRTKFKPGSGRILDGDIMSFQAGNKAEELFWTPFMRNPEQVEQMTGGRERFWIRTVANEFADTWDEVCPGQIVSYKRHVRSGKKVPKDARIVSCHGTPRPHEIKEKSIKSHWK